MSDTIRNENDPIVDPREGHVPPESVEGAHDADGTMGRVAGTGSGLISGAIVGSAAGPVGTVVGAVAGALLGNAAGNAAHHIGDDQDDVNVETGSGGDLGKNAGAGAGSISGAIIGGTAGPVGAVAGAVAGGVLGAAAGNAAKDMGGDSENPNVVPSGYGATAGTTPIFDNDPVVGTTPSGTDYTAATMTPAAGLPGTYIGSGIGAGSVTGTTGVPISPIEPDREYDDVHGHNIVTGEPAVTDAGKSGLGTGAVVGGLIGTAVGGPVGAVVGGTVGSLAGGVAGDAAEASDTGYAAGTGTSGTLGTGTDLTPGNDVPGVQTGGVTTVGADTRGITEKAADAITGDRIDDKTGGYTAADNNIIGTDPDLTPGNNIPGVQTGGVNADGTPDTRGVTEKAADAITGDRIDDKTGRRI